MQTNEFRKINGWTVLLQNKPSAQTLNIRAIVNAGSAHEDRSSIYGAAHFLEHMFFKGTNRFSYSEINRKFAKLGDVNAYTSLEKTVFYMNTLPDLWREGCDVFFDLFFNASMPADEFEKERGVILEEYQSSEDNPISWGIKRINSDTWGQALHPTIGVRESIESMTIEQLIEFKKAFYHPENTLFVFTGNMQDPNFWNELESRIPIQSNNDLSSSSTPNIRFQKSPYELENPNSKQSLLFLVFPTVNEVESRKQKFLPELTVNLIGGGMHSILFESLREKMGLCYAVGMQYMCPGNQGYHSIYALLDAENVDKAYSETINQLHQLTNELPRDWFDTAVSNILFGRSRSFETASGAASHADSYFDNERSLIGFDEFSDGIRSLTPEDIQNFVSEYLKEPKIAVINAKIPE